MCVSVRIFVLLFLFGCVYIAKYFWVRVNYFTYVYVYKHCVLFVNTVRMPVWLGLCVCMRMCEYLCVCVCVLAMNALAARVKCVSTLIFASNKTHIILQDTLKVSLTLLSLPVGKRIRRHPNLKSQYSARSQRCRKKHNFAYACQAFGFDDKLPALSRLVTSDSRSAYHGTYLCSFQLQHDWQQPHWPCYLWFSERHQRSPIMDEFLEDYAKWFWHANTLPCHCFGLFLRSLSHTRQENVLHFI